jgi:Peptidase family M41
MKIDKSKREIFLNRKSQLTNAKIQLKKEFIGIDGIIDEVINIVEPWWVFPKNNIRPTVVNLWGLTGVGKTSLITRLFEILNHMAYFKFDIGDYTTEGDTKLKYEFSNKVKSKEKQSPVIVFDEFQLGRTINPDRSENDRSGLRLVWEILDTGKIFLYKDSWYLNQFLLFYSKLDAFSKKYNIIVKKGEVIGGDIDEFKKQFGYSTEDEENENNDSKEIVETTNEPSDEKKKKQKIWLVPDTLTYKINSVKENDFINYTSIREYLKGLDITETLFFIEECVDEMMIPEEKDFSDSIIFVIGNLDEVYDISGDISPDLDADFFHSHTKEITITEIKDGLLKRYRPEQISRLGNNHLLYPSLNKKAYEDIITLELDKFSVSIKEKYDLAINFDKSVKSILYKESVFPTQGVRPILSTMDNLIKSYVGRIINDIYIEQTDIDEISWFYRCDDNVDDYVVEFSNKKHIYTKIYPVNLKVDSQRRSTNDDSQALIGTHEAGHIIANIFSLNICPKCAFSRTANDKGGFTWLEGPNWHTREYFEKSIIGIYGGYIAEELIFGKENLTSGSYSDLEKITSMAQRMLTLYGMFDDTPSQFGFPHPELWYSKRMVEPIEKDKFVKEFLEKCYNKSKEILEREKVLLLRIGDFLAREPKIEEHEIKVMVEKYSVSEIPEYKNKNNFYDYKKMLEEQIIEKQTEYVGLEAINLNIKKNNDTE